MWSGSSSRGPSERLRRWHFGPRRRRLLHASGGRLPSALLWRCDAEDQRRAWARTETQRQAASGCRRVQPPAHHRSPLIWGQLHLSIVADREVAQIIIVGL